MTPKRPALRYYGGKWNLAPWIISYFPPHVNYVEPCGGAASVLLQKPRSKLETYNDWDLDIVTFFRVLRDRPAELIRSIEMTPWARLEYELSLEKSNDDLEAARRFFVLCWQSYNGAPTSGAPSGWRFTSDHRVRQTPAADMLNNALEAVAARFLGVQIENADWREVITRYDNGAALIYFDPPYVPDTRSNPTNYVYDWPEEEHLLASDVLNSCDGYVIVSGYPCTVYEDGYEKRGWQRVDRLANTNGGGKRTESLWLSPRTVEALSRPIQEALF